MKYLYAIAGAVALGAAAIALILHRMQPDDLYEDARKHRIRQLNKLGDLE